MGLQYSKYDPLARVKHNVIGILRRQTSSAIPVIPVSVIRKEIDITYRGDIKEWIELVGGYSPTRFPIDLYSVTWSLRRTNPSDTLLTIQEICSPFNYEPFERTYSLTGSITNHVLYSKIRRLIDEWGRISFLVKDRQCRIKATQFEEIVANTLQVPRNREFINTIRRVMTDNYMPYVNLANVPTYRNVAFLHENNKTQTERKGPKPKR